MPTARRQRATAKPDADAQSAVPGVRVRSRSGSPRRRAGLQFSRQWRVFEPGRLTQEQIDAILADAGLQTELLPKH